MPLTGPALDRRTFQDLLNEAKARIAVHNPEWTNFNQSDPGITLLELFAFFTETLLYRANRIPEDNRRAFLSLLGIPLQPATAAQGLITLTNERGAPRTITLNGGLEVSAGPVPFRTERGLDVLPIEAQIYYKKRRPDPTGQLTDYYKQLYASYMLAQPNVQPALYEAVLLPTDASAAIDLAQGQDTVDGALWIALLVRTGDKPYEQAINDVRKDIAGKTLSLGIVPYLADALRQLTPGASTSMQSLLQYQLPAIPLSGGLPTTGDRLPAYRTLDASATRDLTVEPGVVEITLPEASQLVLWNNLDPLEAGTGNLPPALDDTNLNERLITWIRVSATAGVQAKLLWMGINAVTVTQKSRILNEQLPLGTGEPDQTARLAKTPVIAGSVNLTSIMNNSVQVWNEVDDLLSAGPEVPVIDRRLPPGTPPPEPAPAFVFKLDPEAGLLQFGDATHGARPPFGAVMRASYDYCVGEAGNVGPGVINASPVLPAGLKVNNPISAWGGAAAETVSEGEKQITRYLQHRDRLVSAADFETITRRTPGIAIGRVEVLPAFNPDLGANAPGDAPGAVTLMVIPRYDHQQPDAPLPDRLFLNTICDYLDSRRLVTTEVFLRGPTYKRIWLSVGIQAVPGFAQATVREDVKNALKQFLAPLPPPDSNGGSDSMVKGWPLRKAVIDLELLAVASKVPGVWLINNILVAEEGKPPAKQIDIEGLTLPQVVGISVVIGDALTIDQVRGQPVPALPGTFVAIPVIPEDCT